MVGSPRAGDEAGLIAAAIRLARGLQERATALQTPQERRQQAELDRMIQHPDDKATLVQMTDQAFRSSAARRSADQLTHILDVQGVPRFFSPLDRTLLRGFQSFGGYLPGVAVPLVKEKMQQETANVVLPAEPDLLAEHLRARREEGVRMNVNFLGEALLGEAEAERRLEAYLQALQSPDIEVVSVKISTIFSQISHMAARATIERGLCDRFELLVRAAATASEFVRADGSRVPKLVYLDMEEYRDLAITVETFHAHPRRPGLERASGGHRAAGLRARLVRGPARSSRSGRCAASRRDGAPITLRIVKGANLEMERVEASLRGWPTAPFQTKRETDANYKRMLEYALEPEHARAVRVGVASHNLFELAYALVLARGARRRVPASTSRCSRAWPTTSAARSSRRRGVLLYAPGLSARGLHPRDRLPGSAPRREHGPGQLPAPRLPLSVDSDDWHAARAGLRRIAFEAIPGSARGPRRTQDRRAPPAERRPSRFDRGLARLSQRARHRLRPAPPRRVGAVDRRRAGATAATTRSRSRWSSRGARCTTAAARGDLARPLAPGHRGGARFAVADARADVDAGGRLRASPTRTAGGPVPAAERGARAARGRPGRSASAAPT